MDKTTGREQSVTIQGASTLSESEINRMLKDAAEHSRIDQERKERVEKRNRAEALADTSQRRLKEVALDFGTQFASYYRRRIEALIEELRESLARDDERGIDRAQADLQDALYELNREVRLQYEDEDDDLFGSIKRTFLGDDEDDRIPPYRRESMNSRPRSRPRYERDYYEEEEYERRPPRRSSRRRPFEYENDWDEEDDDWF
jgi:molecular chaperone DnaK